MQSQTLLSSETMKVEYFFDEHLQHRNLAYVFTPHMNRSLEGNAYGGEIFFRNGFDTIAFKISNDDWFQSIPLELFEAINRINEEKRYAKKMSYGSSMGGYAAIALSKHLDCTAAIAFSPQYSIDEEFDTRWKTDAKKINFKYRISENSVHHECQFFLFFDNKDDDDLHIKKLLNVLPVERTQLIKLPFTGHPCIHYLAEVGLLKNLLIEIANEDRVDHTIDFLANRHLSKSYFLNLCICLLKKNHLRWSLSAIDSAIKIDGAVPDFHYYKSTVLEKMGKVDEAIVAIKEAMRLDSKNSHLPCHLSHLLNQQGFKAEAVEACKKSISLDPNNAHLFAHLSSLLFQQNQISEALLAIDSAIEIDATVAYFHRCKSAVLDSMGKVDEAIAAIKAALNLDPNNSRDKHQLRYLLGKQDAVA